MSNAQHLHQRALRALHSFRGDPLKPLDEAIAADPGFAAAYADKALMLCTVFERRFMQLVLQTLDQGRAALKGATPQVRARAEAARTIASGDWHGGTRQLDQLLVEHPRDLLALQVAHFMDFFRGDALNLRNRVSRVLPAWSAQVPGYAYVLGMHAFGYEECNQFADAESAGRRAVELSGDDCWAVHAVAHVMEMQGRIGDGINWLESTREVWASEDNGFAYHNAWHLALFHMDRGDLGAALKIYDQRFSAGLETALASVDATGLLWRLKIEGTDVEARFAKVADRWESMLEGEGGFYAFNDFFAALSFAATGRRQALARLQEALARAARESNANAEMTRVVAQQACDGAIAYCEGRYADATEKLAMVRDGAVRFGGSNAQRDVLTLTLIDSATRAGAPRVARHYANERLVHKPSSAWGKRLVRRLAPEALAA